MSSPWWNLASTALGGTATFAGVFWAQRKTSQREQRQSDTRYERDRADRFEQQRRDVYLDMVRHAQHRQIAMGRLTDPEIYRDEILPDLVHVDVLTALVRVYATPALTRAWTALMQADAWITSIEASDSLPRDPRTTQRYLPEDHPAALCTHVACEIIVLGIRTVLEPAADREHVEAVTALVDQFGRQMHVALNAEDDQRDQIVASLKITLAILQHPAGDLAALAHEVPTGVPAGESAPEKG